MWLADRSANRVPPTWKMAERMKRAREMVDWGGMMAEVFVFGLDGREGDAAVN